MAELLTLIAMVYLVWGLARLIRVGFVAEFNRAWAEAFNEPTLSPGHVMCLVVLMFFALLWAWMWWPLTAYHHRHDLADGDV